MKFVVSSSLLSSRLQAAGRIINGKNTISILDCFVFDIKGTVLTIVGSDNENTLTTNVDLVESEKDLRVAVNAKTIQDSIKEIPEQPLEFYVNEDTMEITVVYQNGQFKIMAQSAENFPMPPAMSEEVSKLSVNAADLVAQITRVQFATGNDTLRPVMNGCYLDANGDGVTIVASDGRKMALVTLSNVTKEGTGAFILPKKPAAILRALFNKEEGNINVVYDQRNALFTTETSTLNCRLIEGRYPNYASVIPSNNPNEVTINRTALLGALRRVLIFSSVSSALIRLQLNAGNLTVSSQNVDFGMSAEESMLCDYNGMPITIGFSGASLTELLTNLESEEVTFKLADASRAGLVVPTEQTEGISILMLLMPMMLTN